MGTCNSPTYLRTYLVRCTFTKYRHKANVGLVAHTCPVGEYNEMATLLFSSQEGIVELVFSRHEPALTQTQTQTLTQTRTQTQTPILALALALTL